MASSNFFVTERFNSKLKREVPIILAWQIILVKCQALLLDYGLFTEFNPADDFIFELICWTLLNGSLLIDSYRSDPNESFGWS
mmetsp:Transcript_18876/g.41791  ORF Transcript_18876/g.41791 Transcript_18876/m.41791 type:complete len:83 (+) Transcript_18876:2354-2602(+)